MVHDSVFEPQKIFSECQILMSVLIGMKSSNYLSFFSSTSFAFIADNWPWSLILSNSLVKCEFFFQLTRHGRLNFVQTISSIVALIHQNRILYLTWLQKLLSCPSFEKLNERRLRSFCLTYYILKNETVNVQIISLKIEFPMYCFSH